MIRLKKYLAFTVVFACLSFIFINSVDKCSDSLDAFLSEDLIELTAESDTDLEAEDEIDFYESIQENDIKICFLLLTDSRNEFNPTLTYYYFEFIKPPQNTRV